MILITFILAAIIVLVTGYIFEGLFTILYLVYVRLFPSTVVPLGNWKAVFCRVGINFCSNILAVYMFVKIFTWLGITPKVGMLIIPLLISIWWSIYLISKIKKGRDPIFRRHLIVQKAYNEIATEYGGETAEMFLGTRPRKYYLLRSEYADISGNILGLVFGAIFFL